MFLKLIPQSRTKKAFVIPRSDRDRWGPLGHRKVAEFKQLREHQHRRQFKIALVLVCLVGFASPFAVSYVRDLSNSTPERTEPPPISSPTSRAIPQNVSIPVCRNWIRAVRGVTCLVDGDTGWENGVKWRLSDVDTPEISSPGCSEELEKGLAARERLQDLMAAGYSIEWLGSTDRYSRQLVNIKLRDGRDAGRVLLGEGLARPYPNSRKAWCSG